MALERSSRFSRRMLLAVAVLLTLFAAQAILSMRHKSVTADEVMYPAAGYYHLRTGKFDLNLTNPPLMKLITALPLLILAPDLPEIAGDPSALSIVEQWKFGRSFFFDNRVDAEVLLFTARLPVVALGVVLGIYVFLWGRRLYGDRAGLLALMLYALSPNILAHTRLATHDLGLSVFVFIAAYYFWRYVNRPSLPSLVGCGVAFSAAALTKTTAVFMIPMGLAYCSVLVLGKGGLGIWSALPLVSRIDSRQIRARQLVSLGMTFLAIGFIALLALNSIYLFEGSFQPLSTYISAKGLEERLPLGSEFGKAAIGLLGDVPVPIPWAALQIVKFQASLVGAGNSVYFMGELPPEGLWYLMAVAFLIKTPIPLLCLLGAALFQLGASRNIADAEWLILIASIVLLALFSYLKGSSVGLRYVLPMFPFLHILASRSLRDGAVLGNWTRVVLVLLVGWYAVGTARIYPHYLAYFNEFIGGPSKGYRYLADSYLDWGQDLKGLKEYLDKNDIKRIRLAYFGSADAAYYGIDYEYLPSVGLAPRPPEEKWWYEAAGSNLSPLRLTGEPLAISATLLAGIFYPGYYEALRGREPVAQIGYSILIYDFDD